MSTDKDKLALTGDVVRAAFARMEEDMKSNPQAWYPMLTSMVVALADKLDVVTKVAIGSAREVQKYRKIFEALAQQVEASQGGATPSDAPQAPAAPATNESGERLGADGTPLSPEQAAIEAQMDAAIGSAPATPAPTGAPGRRGRGRAKVAAPPVERLGADGTPLSPEQAAIEAEMDAAMGIES
jgi:hypothetical protein